MRTVIWTIERLSGASGAIIAWLVLPLIIATCFEVVSRYYFNAPTIWAFEAGYMAMGAHALIGTAYTLREQGHIRIDIVYSHRSERYRAIIDALGYLFLFLPVITWLAIELWEYWVEAFVSGESSGQSAWNPVIWPFRLSFFIGIALLWLQGIAQFIKVVLFLTGRREAIETDPGRGAGGT